MVDDFILEVPSIEIDLNLTSRRVTRVLDRIAEWRGYFVQVGMDNALQYIALCLSEWAEEHVVKLEFIKLGKPT